MSNDKPTAIATIKFYPNKHVEAELSSIQNITPRTLDIASNILMKTYRGMKGRVIAKQHEDAREAAKQKEIDDAKAEKKWHEDEDKRLAKAAAEDMPPPKDPDTKDPDAKAEVKAPVTTDGPKTADAANTVKVETADATK